MRLLYSTHYLYPLRGGASRSIHGLLAKLAVDHEVHVIYPGIHDADGETDGIHTHMRGSVVQTPQSYFSKLWAWLGATAWKRTLTEFVARSKPDVLLTSMEYAAPSVEVAKAAGIPSILFIHDYCHFCPDGFINGTDCSRRCWSCAPRVNPTVYNCFKHVQDLLQHPFTKMLIDWHERAITGANLVVANSHYVAELTKRWYAVDTRVIYPLIDLSRAVAESRGDYITFVNPLPHKGVRVFTEIVDRMRDRAFLCVGGMPPLSRDRNAFQRLSNLNYLEWVSDVKRVYSETSILLVPSIWPEPFGVVCVEAMASGIPCVVSDSGALPEVVGSAGLVVGDVFDIDAWVEAISRLDDQERYEGYAAEARKRAIQFDPQRQYEAFKDLLATLI
jgi:glycosyltransferase involved in cell wall biosynthesis